MQQYTNKVRGEEDRKLLKMNVNNVAFEILCHSKCFIRMEMHSTPLLELKHTHNVFW